MTEMNRWQNPEDGFPTDDYFGAVERALMDAGVTVADGWRDEPYDFTLQLGETEASMLGYAAVYVGWRVDEESEPLTSGWEPLTQQICGWHWVPYSDPKKGGDFAERFDVDVLAEPEQVAASIIALMHPGGEASC